MPPIHPSKVPLCPVMRANPTAVLLSATQGKPLADPGAGGAVPGMSKQVQPLQIRCLLSPVVQAKPSAEAAADSARAVLGAALMVAAVEAATAAQLRAAALAPRAVNHVSIGPHLALRDLHAQECCRLQQ